MHSLMRKQIIASGRKAKIVMKRKHSSATTVWKERQSIKMNKSVRFADTKLSIKELVPSSIPPPALSAIPNEEKVNVWYSIDDVNQFKLSARILALRVRQSDRQRALDEDEINSTTCERRRSSLQSVYDRNMDKASQDVQSSCLDMDTEEVRNLWDSTTAEVDDFETHGIVPRGLELQISFARQRRQKVGVLKLLDTKTNLNLLSLTTAVATVKDLLSKTASQRDTLLLMCFAAPFAEKAAGRATQHRSLEGTTS